MNRHLRFILFQKTRVCVGVYCVYCLCGCVNDGTHTQHISELKYAPTHGTFPSFLEIEKTAGANWLQSYDSRQQSILYHGGGGNIAIVTALLLLIFVLIGFIYSILYGTYSTYILRLSGTSVFRCGGCWPWPPVYWSWRLQNTLQ